MTQARRFPYAANPVTRHRRPGPGQLSTCGGWPGALFLPAANGLRPKRGLGPATKSAAAHLFCRSVCDLDKRTRRNRVALGDRCPEISEIMRDPTCVACAEILHDAISFGAHQDGLAIWSR
jgi:hypothetical protein